MILVRNTRRVRSDHVAIHAWSIHLKCHRFVNQTCMRDFIWIISSNYAGAILFKFYILYFRLHLILHTS